MSHDNFAGQRVAAMPESLDEFQPEGPPTPLQILEKTSSAGLIKTAQVDQCRLLLTRQSISGVPLVPNTALDASALLALDLALAKGRITPADFVRKYNRPKPAVRSASTRLAAIDEVRLYADHVRIDGWRVPINQITSVRYGSETSTLNVVRSRRSSFCTVTMTGRPALRLYEDGAYSKAKRHAAIVNFGTAIALASFESRVRHFFRQLRIEGKVAVSLDVKAGWFGTQPGVALTVDGHVEGGAARIALKDAKASGELLFGTRYRARGRSSPRSRPDEVAVSLTKLAWYKPRSGIVFTPTLVDADVVHYALDWLARNPDRLTSSSSKP
jgi:hypothetical protein